MATQDLIKDFSSFAVSRLTGLPHLSIDQLYEEWRTKTFAEADSLAVMGSIRDLESGERGQPLGEFLAGFDARRANEE